MRGGDICFLIFLQFLSLISPFYIPFFSSSTTSSTLSSSSSSSPLPSSSSGNVNFANSTAVVCSRKQAHDLSKYFHQVFYDKTSCPLRKYLLNLRTNDDKQKIFIDLGANKGYNFATMYSLWAPQLKIDPMKWYQMAVRNSTKPASYYHGQCKDYLDNSLSSSQSYSEYSQINISNIKFLAIDLSLGSLKLIQDIVSRLSDELHLPLTISTLHAAMSSQNGVTHVGNCIKSVYERCRIESTARYAVPMMTIDSLWFKLPSILQLSTTKEWAGQTKVDILMIDTEGSDAFVIYGGRNVLSSRLVRLLIFEYHGECPWPLTNLSTVVGTLATYGYICYFEGQNRLWRLTGCWSPLYEIHRWSNILCIDQDDEWYPLLDKYRVQPQLASKKLMKKSKKFYMIDRPNNCTV